MPEIDTGKMTPPSNTPWNTPDKDNSEGPDMTEVVGQYNVAQWPPAQSGIGQGNTQGYGPFYGTQAT